jgi:hypothetical protein
MVGQAVVLDDKLGSGMANLESLGCPVDGHLILYHQFDQLFSLLNYTGITLLVMMLCAFFNSLSLLYSSSAYLLDICFYWL